MSRAYIEYATAALSGLLAQQAGLHFTNLTPRELARRAFDLANAMEAEEARRDGLFNHLLEREGA